MDIDWKERVLWCERAGLSRAEIAESCGLSYSSLGDLMRGATREPRGMAAVKLWQLSERMGPLARLGVAA